MKRRERFNFAVDRIRYDFTMKRNINQFFHINQFIRKGRESQLFVHVLIIVKCECLCKYEIFMNINREMINLNINYDFTNS